MRTPLLGESPRQLAEDFAGSLAHVFRALGLSEFEDQDQAQAALAGDDAGRIWPIRVVQRHLYVGGGRLKVGLQKQCQELDGDSGGGGCWVHLAHGTRD